MKLIGIDPGLEGAIAVLYVDSDGLVVSHIFDMPTVQLTKGKRQVSEHGLIGLLVDIGQVDHVAVETVTSSPQMGVTSAFNFGRGVGVIATALVALKRPTTYLRPQEWQKAVGRPNGAGKDWSLTRARQLWPDTTLFDRQGDDGRAEAALIALAWWNLNRRTKEDAA